MISKLIEDHKIMLAPINHGEMRWRARSYRDDVWRTSKEHEGKTPDEAVAKCVEAIK